MNKIVVPAKSTGTGPEPVPAQIPPEPEFRSGPYLTIVVKATTRKSSVNGSLSIHINNRYEPILSTFDYSKSHQLSNSIIKVRVILY